MVDLKRDQGKWQVVIGPWAKLIMGVSGTFLAAGGIWLVTSVNTLITQQAVTNVHIIRATQQLEAFPGLNERVSLLEYQIDALRQDLRTQELRMQERRNQ